MALFWWITRSSARCFKMAAKPGKICHRAADRSIQRFRGEVFIVKYGGSFMDSPDPAERHRVAREIVFLEAVGINPVIVHGGGKAVTRAVEAAGLTTQFLQGQRVTDEATMKLVDEVLSRRINPEIVASIEALG